MLINHRYHNVNKSTGLPEVSVTFSEQMEHRSGADFCQSAGHSIEWPVQKDLELISLYITDSMKNGGGQAARDRAAARAANGVKE